MTKPYHASNAYDYQLLIKHLLTASQLTAPDQEIISGDSLRNQKPGHPLASICQEAILGLLMINNLSAFVIHNVSGFILSYFRDVYEPGRLVTGDQTEDSTRYHYVKATVEVIRHLDGSLSVMYGPRRLAQYDSQGQIITPTKRQAVA